MITKDEFINIEQVVINSIDTTLDHIRDNYFNNYILYLADGEYLSDYATIPDISPWVVDYRVDWYKDKTRLDFLVKFLKEYYSFSSDVPVDDDHYRIHLEMMVYMHIWEAKSYLKRLKRLSQLTENGTYLWEVNVPDMGKHDFIRNDIRNQFMLSNNDLAQIISNGYHSSIRNAFAHSEYTFEEETNGFDINLLNCGNAAWELRGLSYNDWSVRFSNSFLLSYHVMNSFYERRNNLIESFNTDTFSIEHPQRGGKVHLVDIQYQALPQDSFNFKR